MFQYKTQKLKRHATLGNRNVENPETLEQEFMIFLWMGVSGILTLL